MYTFQNFSTAVNDKIWPDLDLGRRSKGVCYWKVLPKSMCGPNIKAVSWILQQLCTLFETKPLSCWTQIYPAFANSVDPDQLASEESNWYGSTVCHSVGEFISTFWIKTADWLMIRSGRGILIYSAWQGLKAKLEHVFKWQSMIWPWPRQKVKLRKGCVLLKGRTLR